MKYFFAIIVLLYTMGSCKDPKARKKVTIKSQYSIKIPSYLTKATKLHKKAPAQYQSLWNELYVTVLDEKKIDLLGSIDSNQVANLDGYTNLMVSTIEETMQDPTQTEILKTTINGLDSRIIQISGKVDGIDILYYNSFIESDKHFIQIVTWTPLIKTDTNLEDMKDIVRSLEML